MIYPFLCFDTEDDSKELLATGKSGFDKQVTQIAAIDADGAKFYNRGDRDSFLKWLERHPAKFIYAHNLQYDLGNLFSKRLDLLDITMVGGRLIKAKWGKKIFVDSFNIWPMAAKKLGEAFGLEKMDTENMATDRAYVFRDVEIIRAAMLFAWGFVDSLGLPWLPPTLGGLCIKVWQHWGGVNCHDSTEISREALFGGRTELFKTENETDNVVWTDINSLYPAVMANRVFPGPLEDCGKKLPGYGVATVTVKVPKTELATLPYRNDEGRILYPWGLFKGTWTLAELRAAESNGAKIQKVHSCYGTDETMQPYGEFVRRLYAARLASDSEAEKLFFKLLMNNLYGRLGTTGRIGRSVWQTEKNRFNGVPYGEKVLVNYQMPLAEETNWSHAAYVTAYGRIELLNYAKILGADRMIYGDTDSAIFEAGNGRFSKDCIPFKTGGGLGEMKIVQRCSVCGQVFPHKPACKGSKGLDYWKDCATYAPKMYQAGKVFKAKGVPVRLAKQFIQSGRADFDLPFKMREAIAFYDERRRDGKIVHKANSRELSVWRNVEKFARSGYDRKKLVGKRYFPCQIRASG